MTSIHVAGRGLQAGRSLAVAGLLLSAGIVSAQDTAIAGFRTVDSIEARVQGCATCRGQSGQGTSNEYFPRIAGKPAADPRTLIPELKGVRDGSS
jgi:cytochrome c553